MTTTEDLYQQANETYVEYTRRVALASLERAGLRAVVDLVIAARPARLPWEVLREAADIMHPKSHPRGLWTPEERALRDEAKRLEAEHRAAQEEAEREAEREKLIEQAKSVIAPHRLEHDRKQAAALVDAGWRPAPESDGGAA